MKSRYLELDILRSLAILGMIAYHAAFILVFFHAADIRINDGIWPALGQFVRHTFLILVGISLAVSYQQRPENFLKRNMTRAALILILAMLITLATYIAIPKAFVRFGILHFIAVSIFLCGFIANKKYLPLLLAILVIPINFLLKQQIATSTVLFILGLQPQGLSYIDHFAIFPWIGLPLLGIFLGNILYPRITKPLESSASKVPIFISKNSLLIYMIHVPIILAIFKISGMI